jgi:anti-sigma factor RsiW
LTHSAAGLSLAVWSESGLRFAAVSDVDPRELERFASLVRENR